MPMAAVSMRLPGCVKHIADELWKEDGTKAHVERLEERRPLDEGIRLRLAWRQRRGGATMS